MNWLSKNKAERAHLFDKVEVGEKSICKSVEIKEGEQWNKITELAFLTVMPCLTCASRNGKR